MVDYNEIKKMSVDRLMTYYGALSSICNWYAQERDKYFNPMTQSTQEKWKSTNNLLNGIKPYYDVVLNALKDRVVSDLESFKATSEEDKKSYVPKKEVTVRRGRPKKSEN